MLDREDIQGLLEEIKDNEVLVLKYSGFNGHGINGVSSQSTRLRTDVNMIVNMVEHYDGEVNKTELISYELRANYIMARYIHYKKGKYCKEFNNGREYGVIVPYDSINSIEIVRA